MHIRTHQKCACYIHTYSIIAAVFSRSDRPDFVVQVPDGGFEIQDAPVHWTLPCGRAVCMSLREFTDAKDDQLMPGCTDEVRIVGSYRVVANCPNVFG